MGPQEAGPGWKALAGSAPGSVCHVRGGRGRHLSLLCKPAPSASSSSILTSLYSAFMAGPSRDRLFDISSLMVARESLLVLIFMLAYLM